MSLILDLLVIIGVLYAILVAALILLASDEWRHR
jgi:hypothetical protein